MKVPQRPGSSRCLGQQKNSLLGFFSERDVRVRQGSPQLHKGGSGRGTSAHGSCCLGGGRPAVPLGAAGGAAPLPNGGLGG